MSHVIPADILPLRIEERVGLRDVAVGCVFDELRVAADTVRERLMR